MLTTTDNSNLWNVVCAVVLYLYDYDWSSVACCNQLWSNVISKLRRWAQLIINTSTLVCCCCKIVVSDEWRWLWYEYCCNHLNYVSTLHNAMSDYPDDKLLLALTCYTFSTRHLSSLSLLNVMHGCYIRHQDLMFKLSNFGIVLIFGQFC